MFEALTFEMITILKVVSFGIDGLLNSSENEGLYIFAIVTEVLSWGAGGASLRQIIKE